jgi:NAD(P)H-dependent FMN reductase
MSDVKLLFLSGSVRTGSHNTRLATLGAEIARANGLNATLADLKNYTMPLYDGDLESGTGAPEAAVRLKALISDHRGAFIAAPEYNASITPLLKNTLDWVSRVRSANEAPLEVYRTRVFAVGSASPGGFGGMRGLITLRQSLVLGLGCVVLPEQISISRAQDAFEDNGHLKDKGLMEAFKALVQKLGRSAQLMHP